MTDPRLVACFVAWVKAREPRLGDHVRPAIEEPNLVAPYLTFTFMSWNRLRNFEGRTGQTTVRVQIDIWDQDHERGASIAHNLAGLGFGEDETRGLDQFSGVWTHPDPEQADCIIQYVEMLDDGFDDLEPPILGMETGWYRFSGDFAITYEEVS